MTPASFKAWRMELGLTQQQAAEALGVKRITIYRWEEGKWPVPKMAAIACNGLTLSAVVGNQRSKGK